MLIFFAMAALAADSVAYAVGVGDTLQVQVYGEPALSGSFPVGDAGQLDIPLLGAVDVRGLTTTEIAALLRSKLEPEYVVEPNVTVWITNWRSQPVQVLGAVSKPGTYFLRGPTTVLQVLAEAGSVSRDGVNEVRITHADGRTEAIPYDRLLVDGGAQVALGAGDVVYVPQSVITVMGQVEKPGEVAFRDGLMLSHCVAAAGGALPTAALGRVIILRGETKIPVNLRKVLQGDLPDVAVQPGDRVFVQESVF